MNTIVRRWLRIALVGILLCGSTALAVPPYPDLSTNAPEVVCPTYRWSPQRPVTSPYLTLAPGGLNLAGVNYFNLVQPLINQQQINARQSASIGQLEHRIQQSQIPASLEEQEGGEATAPTRKHAPAGYMTHGKYFGLQRVSAEPRR